MAKEKATGFNLLVPFSIKSDTSGEDLETIKIEGIANFCGDLSDDKCIEVDLAGEVVVPAGMDISVYKGNPQILWQHDRECSIGVCDKITKKKDGIYIEATIHKGAMCEEDWYRVKNGLVTRFSVGFRCKGGEFKEINGRSVYFITKSLLLEISIVTIPASSSSSFSVVKSLGEDGEDGLYSGDMFNKSEDTQEETKTLIGDKMKLKLKEFLSEEEVAKYKSLGLDELLEQDQEVEIKSYVDSIVKAALSALKEEIVKELSTTTEEETEESEKSEEETEESTEEGAEKSEEEVEGTEEGTDEASEEEKAADADTIKNLTETIAQLRVLVEDTK